jgi:hypothetical protein
MVRITSVWFGTVRRKEWAHTKDAEVAKAEASMDIRPMDHGRTARSEVLALPSGIFFPRRVAGGGFWLQIVPCLRARLRQGRQAAFLTSQVRHESGAH